PQPYPLRGGASFLKPPTHHNPPPPPPPPPPGPPAAGGGNPCRADRQPVEWALARLYLPGLPRRHRL
ncbi:hypothetical protein Q6A19_19660, partial [Xanthomonas euvesicatoria pv. eucalypti]|nr:hypothetical protein [Xanthomonas euvesicatoria pv. eucalypti]